MEGDRKLRVSLLSRECNPVPENPGISPVFKPVNRVCVRAKTGFDSAGCDGAARLILEQWTLNIKLKGQLQFLWS